MQYDLNFWPEPDWQRESSVDPYFLLVLFLALLMVVCVGLAAWNAMGIQHRRGELLALEIHIGKTARAAAEVQRQLDCLALWDQVTRRLEACASGRPVLCRQLAAIQSLVPEAVTLTRLSLDSVDSRAEGARPATPAPGEGAETRVRAPKENVQTRYVMTITGVARGANAEQVITEFSRAIPMHADLRPLLSTVELTSVVTESRMSGRDEAAGPGKEFVIVCRYKPKVLEHANQ